MLILVLWSLSLLAVFSVSLSYGMRQKLTLLSSLEKQEALFSIAFSGIERSKSAVLEDADLDFDSFAEPWAQPKQFLSVKVEGGQFSVFYTADGQGERFGVVDETRKINLNTADAAVLMQLLKVAADLDSDKAEEIAYAIIDWRDSDSTFQHAQYGAEDGYYDDLLIPYEAKDAKFELPQELLLIKGITPAIFDKIQPYLTAHGSGLVNLNTAPEEVFVALGMPSGLAGKIIAYRAGPDGKEATADDYFFKSVQVVVTQLDNSTPPPDQSERTILSDLISAEKLATASTIFSARSRGVLEKGGQSMEITAVFDRKGNTAYLRVSSIR